VIPTLSVVIPCYNESATLEACVARVRAIASSSRSLEIVIVDDASSDDSLARAHALSARHPEVRVVAHAVNQGKGAALRSGFRHVTGQFVAIQDADLEYDPQDLIRLLEPLEAGKADAVLGSRFLSGGAHRVLYFWHSAGNRFLTLLSNVFTDLNLTDIETCYKVFRREVIQSIEIEEDRFGFEPEIVAKLADRRLRIYEAGISYDGRTYAEGKKIGARDGLRALYCIVRYNARSAPAILQLAVYAAIAGVAGIVDWLAFAGAWAAGVPLGTAAAGAYALAASVNYFLCLRLLYPREPGSSLAGTRARYAAAALVGGALDLALTSLLVETGSGPLAAKAVALLPFPVLDFWVRRRLVFRHPSRGPWEPHGGRLAVDPPGGGGSR
jgi:dolichol-phosphate mannosyltransferase